MVADREPAALRMPAAGQSVDARVELGPRPQLLVDDMRDGPLKTRLQACLEEPPRRTAFSIGHRGAGLVFPEHTREAYEAGFRMGAGTLECDVTFTKDLALVCRHSQNDLATTTDILLTPLARTCIEPFTPAVLNESGAVVRPARAECRTSELTLDEFKSLRGKVDAFDRGRADRRAVRDAATCGTPGSRRGRRARHAAHARREHRVVSEPGRANDARAQGAECRAAVQRAHARPARPTAHR